ncbi:MAG: YdbH domain-containing protein, partial [Opitutales bacterium]
PFPEMYFSNLRLPRWRIPFTDPARLPLGESKTFQFEDFSLADDSFTFNLYEGELTIAFPAEGEVFGVRLAPTDAVLPLQGVTFRNFSFAGVVEPFRVPCLSLPQSLSVEGILLGDESMVENVAMSFHLLNMSKLFVDSLALSLDGTAYELNPAKLTMEQLGDDVLSLDFNGSTFSLPDLEVKMEGFRAGIRLASVDPLATAGPQELYFDAIRYGSLAITDGRLFFSLDANGTFAIHDGEAKLLGGSLVFEPTRFDLFGEETYVTLRLRNLDGSRIASLFEKFDGEITGTFSGRIPLRKAAGQLGLTGGFLELNKGFPGRLRYRSDGLLTEGMQPAGSEYKLRRNTELALKDLDLKRLRLDFVEEDGERQIQGQVQGKAQIDKKTTIDLNYRPRIHVDLWELLQEIDFETLGLD